MQIIPLIDTQNQTITTSVANQVLRVELWTRQGMLFADVYILDTLIVGGVVCENRNRLVRNRYLGMIGDLMFFDTGGLNDPASPGLGTRYQLGYLTVADLGGVG